MKGACLTCHDALRRRAVTQVVVMSLRVRVRVRVVPGCLGAWVPGGEGTMPFLPINTRRRASSAKQSKEVPNHSLGPEQSKQTPSPPWTRPQAQTATPTHRAGQHSTAQHSTGQDGPGPGRAGQDRPGQGRAEHGRAGQHSAAQYRSAPLSTAQHSTGADNQCSRNRAARLALRPWSWWKAEGQAALLSS
jgi:hypothetical protein